MGGVLGTRRQRDRPHPVGRNPFEVRHPRSDLKKPTRTRRGSTTWLLAKVRQRHPPSPVWTNAPPGPEPFVAHGKPPAHDERVFPRRLTTPGRALRGGCLRLVAPVLVSPHGATRRARCRWLPPRARPGPATLPAGQAVHVSPPSSRGALLRIQLTVTPPIGGPPDDRTPSDNSSPVRAQASDLSQKPRNVLPSSCDEIQVSCRSRSDAAGFGARHVHVRLFIQLAHPDEVVAAPVVAPFDSRLPWTRECRRDALTFR